MYINWKVTVEKKWRSQNFDLVPLKNLCPGQFLGSSLLQTSCCNLKIIGMGAKLCVAFLLFNFLQDLWRFKVKESLHFVEQKYKL